MSHHIILPTRIKENYTYEYLGKVLKLSIRYS